MATFEYTHRRGCGPKNHSRSRIKKRREKRGENSIYATLPYFSICYVYTFPRRVTRFFLKTPLHFRARFSALYRTGYANENKRFDRIYNNGHTRISIAKRRIFKHFRICFPNSYCIDK